MRIESTPNSCPPPFGKRGWGMSDLGDVLAGRAHERVERWRWLAIVSALIAPLPLDALASNGITAGLSLTLACRLCFVSLDVISALFLCVTCHRVSRSRRADEGWGPSMPLWGQDLSTRSVL